MKEMSTMTHIQGRAIVRANASLTALFVVSAVIATVVFDDPWKNIAAGIALGCFAAGVVVFLWGYWTAVQRSRVDNIAVSSLYFLVDNCAPKSVARMMNGLLALQVVVSIATASVRSSTNGEPGSTLAYGILVPMLGLGLNGLWGAFYGSFRPRGGAKNEGVLDEGTVSGQDVGHD
jgi:hypothetical protein